MGQLWALMGEWFSVEGGWEEEWEEWMEEDDTPLSPLVDILLEVAKLIEDEFVEDFLLFLRLQTLLCTGFDLISN